MVSSMVADICDEDELLTGRRREGMFGAVNGFVLKAALALTSLIGGWLLTFSGFDPNTASAGISVETALMMKNLIIGFQVVALIAAIVVFAFYPISRKRAEETRRILEDRKKAGGFYKQ
jgi:GPH family glycoside/pentoside/hexuronide:cation symporter